MTLHDAMQAHKIDVQWLVDMRGVNPEDWDLDLAVTHLSDGINDVYLGEDAETVFVVHGQAEPQLTCDAALWESYNTEERWQEDAHE